MSFRLSFACAAVLLASVTTASAQPPSPIDLVRGLREAGMPDLAVEYIKDAEALSMPDNDRKALQLERAKCLLDLAEDEPDEGTRTGMVGEAKEAFQEFLDKNPAHPRASEASIALARLTSIDAKIQLARARRIEVGDDSKLKEEQRKEETTARNLFKVASQRFADAAKAIQDKIADPSTDPVLQTALKREADDAALAAAINQYLMGDTYLGTDAGAVQERGKCLDDARKAFAALAKKTTTRTAWIARAWMAEALMDQARASEADPEFKAILNSNLMEADEGKRMVRFFQARRNYLNAIQEQAPEKLAASEKELRSWLSRYGSGGKSSPEALSCRYYLAFTLQIQADRAVVRPKPPATGFTVGDTARRHFVEAEKIYRLLGQSDNDYTARASKNRMHVVRMVLGEADKPATDYTTFETAQMAALIQMAKLADAEKELPNLAAKVEFFAGAKKGLPAMAAEVRRLKTEKEVKDRKYRILTLLERARGLATDKDSPADVTDNLLRLVYFYLLNNHPYQAAVLGEHVARSVRSTGGKASLAGLLGVNGYVIASSKIKAVDTSDPDKSKAALEAADAARRNDRDRALALARFLDEKFPNDQATDAARHRLASMLVEDKKFDQAFLILKKVRAGYAQIASVRLLEGYIANVLITSPAKDMPLPPGGKLAVFRQAVDDLSRVVKPVAAAKDEDVKGYFSVRSRLAYLYLAQSRVEDKPGFMTALTIANEIIAAVPTFDCLKDKEPGKLNPKGLEMHYLGMDARTRAVYLHGKALVDAKQPNWKEAAEAIEPAIADVEKSGAVYDETMKKWAGDPGEDDEGKAKIRVAALAQAVDRNRREIIMVGFKLRVRQGKADEASKMLDLLVKAGGSIEENQPTLEFMARDLAAQIAPLKKAGQKDEAKAMGDGLAILLKRLSSIPNQTTSSTLFLGQTLYLVEQYDDALKEFAPAKIPAPAVPKPPGPSPSKIPEWWQLSLNKYGWFKLTDEIAVALKSENVPDAVLAKLTPLKNAIYFGEDFENQLKKLLTMEEAKTYQNVIAGRCQIDANKDRLDKNKLQDQIRDYRVAQLFTARCYRGLNKFPEGEKLLTTAVGTSDKQGYAYASLDFRKELAMLYEAKGATLGQTKAAGAEWGKALNEWTTLFKFAQSDVSKLKDPTPDQERTVKSRFFDAFFDAQRCFYQANLQLRKGTPRLAETHTTVAMKIVDLEVKNRLAELEKKGMGIITPEVWMRYCDFLDANPDLKNAYKAAKGIFFLERPAVGN